MGNPETEFEPPPSFHEATSGSSGSAPPQNQIDHSRTGFACVTFNLNDRIRFIEFPPDTVHDLQGVVAATWPMGIQKTRDYAGAHELKLHGNPWGGWDFGSDDARRLVRRILEALYDRGWVLQAAVDVTKKKNSKGDTLIFRYRSPAPRPCDWLCIAFDQFDRLRILDRPPEDVAAALLETLGSDVANHEGTSEYFEIKLRGEAWVPSSEDCVYTPMKVARILDALDRLGYSLYANVSEEYDGDGSSTDLLVMQRPGESASENAHAPSLI